MHLRLQDEEAHAGLNGQDAGIAKGFLSSSKCTSTLHRLDHYSPPYSALLPDQHSSFPFLLRGWGCLAPQTEGGHVRARCDGFGPTDEAEACAMVEEVHPPLRGECLAAGLVAKLGQKILRSSIRELMMKS